jgi:hypothetical protein
MRRVAIHNGGRQDCRPDPLDSAGSHIHHSLRRGSLAIGIRIVPSVA